MRRRERPALLDSLVFGLAILLAGVIAYHVFARWMRPAPTAAPVPSMRPAVSTSLDPEPAPRPSGGLIMSDVVEPVGRLPAVKSSRPKRESGRKP